MAADPFPPSAAAPPLSLGRFSLLQLLYAVLLVGAGFGSGHPVGIGFAFAALLGWCYVFWIADAPRVAIAGLLLLAAGVLTLSIMSNAVSHPAGFYRPIYCANNLRTIGRALHMYHSLHGSFPPAYVPDAAGKPAHSWRVFLLPHLDNPSFLQRYDFSEPWNGPRNSLLASESPHEYFCANDPRSAHSPYRLIVGPGTPFLGATAPRLPKVLPPPYVMAIEDPGPKVHWLEPRDLTQQEALALLTDPNAPPAHHNEQYWHETPRGRFVLFSDASVEFVETGMDRSEAEEMLGMRPPGVSWRSIPDVSAGHRRRYENWVRAAILFIVALLPLPWAWARESWTSHTGVIN